MKLNLKNQNEVCKVKPFLADCLTYAMRKGKHPQRYYAEILSIDQPKVSRLYKGDLAGFSEARLLKFALAMGFHVRVTIEPKS